MKGALSLDDANTMLQFKNNHFIEMCCGTEAGSYLRLIDSCMTQLKAQGPSGTCDERKEEKKKYQAQGSGGFRSWAEPGDKDADDEEQDRINGVAHHVILFGGQVCFKI